MAATVVDYFSDALCVWAYVGQIRIEELRARLGSEVDIRVRTLDVFGDARTRLAASWADRGGLSGYGAHVRSVAAAFSHVTVHPDVWAKVAPTSSLPAHLWLTAAQGAAAAGRVSSHVPLELEARIRAAFFAEARDVSSAGVLEALVADVSEGAVSELRAFIDDGQAHALHAAHLAAARRYDVRVSPALVFNEGRQRLFGNVGYRIIESNLQELRSAPDAPYSWC